MGRDLIREISTGPKHTPFEPDPSLRESQAMRRGDNGGMVHCGQGVREEREGEWRRERRDERGRGEKRRERQRERMGGRGRETERWRRKRKRSRPSWMAADGRERETGNLPSSTGTSTTVHTVLSLHGSSPE